MKRPNYQRANVLDFQSKFSSEEACRKHVINMRWPDGFICRCGSVRSAYKPSRKEFQCYDCQRVTSVTSGTIMHKSKVPLVKWFWCMFFIATSKKAISTLYLSGQLKLSYPTAWGIRRKLQKAMAHRDAQWTLKDRIEADEIFIGGTQTHEERRLHNNKTPFFIALEEDRAGNPKFLKIEQIPSVKDTDLKRIATKYIPNGAVLKTDGNTSYIDLAKEKMCVHERVVAMRHPTTAYEHLHWINIITSNLKRYLLSTHHGVFKKYRRDYIAEFVYRFNRRYLVDQALDRLLYANIINGPAPLRGVQGIC